MQQKEKSKDFIGIEIRNKIKELGRLWKESNNNFQIPMRVLNSWEQLISDWAKDTSMPLIIRKGSTRGQEFEHSSGRKIIMSDNTFALWVYHNVLKLKTFAVDEIKEMLIHNNIPMVYALTKEDKKIAKYTKTLGKFSLSDADSKWKLCHIKPVGLNSRKPIKDFPIDTLIEHFKRYANPKNMFLLPKEIGGLGEIQEFINEQTIKKEYK